MATHSSILAWKIPIERRAWWAILHGVRQDLAPKQQQQKKWLHFWSEKCYICFSKPRSLKLGTFFFFTFFKFYFIFKLYNIVLVLPNIEMNPPQVYLCSPSWILLPPPSTYPPSGSSQCTSPKHPVSCYISEVKSAIYASVNLDL